MCLLSSLRTRGLNVIGALTFAVIALYAREPVYAQVTPFDRDHPIIVVLDGMSLFTTCAASLPCKAGAITGLTAALTPLVGALAPAAALTFFEHLSSPRIESYLARELDNKWRTGCECDQLFESTCEFRARQDPCTIVRVPWDGQLANTSQLDTYIVQSKEVIARLVNNNPGRPVVIVAHSWGTVVAFQALIELQLERRVATGSIAELITLGSPLDASTGRPVAGRVVGSLLKALPGVIPGQDLVLNEMLVRPTIMRHWTNFWSNLDLISGPKLLADKNVKVQYPLSITQLVAPFAYIEAHNGYYEVDSVVRNIERAILDRLTGECLNVLDESTTIPNGFGASYNVLSEASELVLRASCKGTRVTITAGSEIPVQYVYQFGHNWTGSSWQQFEFSGPEKVGNAWYVGEAFAELARTPAQLAENNFFVAYVCTWTGSEWKCGCRDEACAQSFWQLQAFRREASPAGATVAAGE